MVQVSQYFSSETPMRIALLIPTLCLLGIVMILAVTAPATGYEVSIYHEYPLIIWILFGLLYLFPFLYLLLAANKTFGLVFRKRHINYILTVSLCGTLLLLSLPLIRGYYCYTGGDILTHMGTILDILNGTASVMINHYPASMVEVSMLHLMSGVAVNQIILCAIQWTVLIFVLGMFCLARRFCTNYTQVAVITALSIIPIMGNFFTQEIFMPSTIGWSLLPMLFFSAYCVVTKVRRHNLFLIVACVLSVGLWYIHSEAIVFGGITLILVLFFILFWPFQRGVLSELNYKGLIVIITVLVLGAIFLITFTNIFSGQVMNYFNIFFGDIEDVNTRSPLEVFGGDSSWFRKIVLLITQMGQLILVSLLSVFLLVMYAVKRRLSDCNLRFVLLSILLLGIGAVAALYLLSGIDVGMFVYRMFKYVLVVCILLIGYIWFLYYRKQKRNFISRVLIIFLIILVIMFSLGNTYNSPEITGTQPLTVLDSDMHGMEIFFTVQNPSNGIIESLTRAHTTRYGKALWGSYFSAGNVRGVSSNYVFPNGMSSNTQNSFSNYFEKDTYLLYYSPNVEYNLLSILEHNNLGFTNNASNYLNYDTSVIEVIDLGDDFKTYLIHV